MKDYRAIVHLVKRPPATRAQWLTVADYAYAAGESIVGSADDAKDIIEDAQPGSFCYVWEPSWWGGLDAIMAYLGVPCIERTFTPMVQWGCPTCAQDTLINLHIQGPTVIYTQSDIDGSPTVHAPPGFAMAAGLWLVAARYTFDHACPLCGQTLGGS